MLPSKTIYMKLHLSLPRFLPTALVLIAILYLSLAPNPVPYENGFFNFKGADKIVHCLMYLGLTGVFCFDFYRKGATKEEARHIITAFTVAIILGGSIEILQEQMQMGRSGSFYDFMADVAGSVIGIISGMWIIRPALLHRRHRQSRHSAE